MTNLVQSLLVFLAMLCFATGRIHTRPEMSLGWRRASAQNVALDDHEVSFLLSLKNSNMPTVRQLVELVSEPTSGSYTQYLTTEEIADLTRPSGEHLKAVMQWLSKSNLRYELVHRGFSLRVTGRMQDAEALLLTNFDVLVNPIEAKTLIRAQDYQLPADVEDAVAAVFGLHGFPLPFQRSLVDQTNPAKVTPAVITSTYSVSGVKPTGATTNRQAVAEFQGQTEKDSDLVAFFKAYVPNAQPGDDKVYADHGDRNLEVGQVEASLDIQYIMGVAPHVKTEFWLYQGSDFCADLIEWTGNLTSLTDGPNVHSISYGWQGNLSQLHCTDDKVQVIDDNFAKLALAGISIIFASGDSGSGYTAQSQCQDVLQDTGHKGDAIMKRLTSDSATCCEESRNRPWTWVPMKTPPSPGCTCKGTDIGTKDTTYTGEVRYTLHLPAHLGSQCCQQASYWGGLKFSFAPDPKQPKYALCTIFNSVNATIHSPGSRAGQSQVINRQGNCSVYSAGAKAVAMPGATSGKASSALPVLWPSWPASSPYVTAVGATRFVGQKVSNEEMATDQFGSGGGFSKQFGQSPNAKWQVEAVKQYTSNPPNDSHYPPKGSFPTTGRATPDVSALGEGYQVFSNGRLISVGGTSASAPAFAGLVSLLNDARTQKGKKPLGFLNPFLYQNPDCFTDITQGTNSIGRGTGPIAYGFNATTGWDPATGLGTPKFGKLLAAALKAP